MWTTNQLVAEPVKLTCCRSVITSYSIHYTKLYDEQDVTIKEKVVRALLNSQRFMSAAELSDITGYRPSVVSTRNNFV